MLIFEGDLLGLFQCPPAAPRRIADWNPRQGIAFVAVHQKEASGAGVPRERAATYRLHAAHCTELAQRISDPKGRLSLLEMSRMWLRLAELCEAGGPPSQVRKLTPLKRPVR